MVVEYGGRIHQLKYVVIINKGQMINRSGALVLPLILLFFLYLFRAKKSKNLSRIALFNFPTLHTKV